MPPAPPAFPTADATLTIPGPAGALECAVEFPKPEEARRGVAVIAHPNPPEGGTMHNKVVTMCARALTESGLTAVRFNFRGVGASAGAFDNGRGEVLDLLAVANWAHAQRAGDALWLGGFSFGSWVALLAARQLPVQHMITIAPPVGLRDFAGVLPPPCPWLLIQGEADDVVPAKPVLDWCATLAAPPKVVLLPGVGHYFHGRLAALTEAVTGMFGEELSAARGSSDAS